MDAKIERESEIEIREREGNSVEGLINRRLRVLRGR